MKLRYGYVYRIWYDGNINSYIGKTINLQKRIKEHLQPSNDNNNVIARAARKHNKKDFRWEVLYGPLPEWMLADLEIRAIDTLNTFKGNGYNSTVGGEWLGAGENHPSFIQITSKDIENIIEKYLSGISVNRLAKEYGVSCCVIRKRLLANDIELRNHKEAAKFENHENRLKSVRRSCTRHDVRLHTKDICDQYLAGDNMSQLARKYKCSSNLIKFILLENNIKLTSVNERRNSYKKGISQ